MPKLFMVCDGLC